MVYVCKPSILLISSSLFSFFTSCLSSPIPYAMRAATTRTARNIIYLVHGTFARNEKWYQYEGEFSHILRKNSVKNTIVRPFSWSGRYSNAHRKQAGAALAHDIKQHCLPQDTITLIGHSHGGNICLYAVNELATQNSHLHIATCISLATPVAQDSCYQPNMRYIAAMYHFFSFGDLIQPVFTMFKRVFPPHPRIWNIQVHFNNIPPGHSELRSPLIAHHLPSINAHVLENDQTLINLHNDGTLTVHKDTNRETNLILDAECFDALVNNETLWRKVPAHEFNKK